MRTWNENTNRIFKGRYKNFQGGFDGAINPFMKAMNNAERSLQETLTERKSEIEEQRQGTEEDLAEGIAKRFAKFREFADTASQAVEDRLPSEERIMESLEGDVVEPRIPKAVVIDKVQNIPENLPAIQTIPVQSVQMPIPTKQGGLGEIEVQSVIMSPRQALFSGAFILAAGIAVGFYLRKRS